MDCCNNKLLEKINVKKKAMYSKAMHYGFTHPVVVSYSQELDNLLNNYQERKNMRF